MIIYFKRTSDSRCGTVILYFTKVPTKEDIEAAWLKWLDTQIETPGLREIHRQLLETRPHTLEVFEND